MEFKNKKFKFINSIYELKFVDRIGNQDEVIFGQLDPDLKQILIATKDVNGNTYKENQIKNTILHELIHLIFFEGQYHECYEDEPLVEWLAKSIKLLIDKKII